MGATPTVPAGMPGIRVYASESRPSVRYRVQRVAGQIVHDAVSGVGLTRPCPGWTLQGHCWHVEAFEADEDEALREAAAALTRYVAPEDEDEHDPFARFDPEPPAAA